MWAKGPAPGATPKNDFLKEYPGATCKREEYQNGMRAYVIYLTDGTHVTARGNSQQAWTEAYYVMKRREERAKNPGTGKPNGRRASITDR